MERSPKQAILEASMENEDFTCVSKNIFLNFTVTFLGLSRLNNLTSPVLGLPRW